MEFRRPAWLHESPVAAWSFALATFLAALALRFAVAEEISYGVPYLTFFPAVIFTAVFSGLWPAIAVAAASTLAAKYFFLPPYWSFALIPSTAMTMVLFIAIVAVIIAVVETMNRALERLEEEKARSAQLAEQRELLFRELQHRISNNLAVVSALLNIERAEVEDEKASQALADAATRLGLIAKIHRKLHDPTGAGLRPGPFLEELCHDVLDASGAKGIVCMVSAADMTVAPDKSVPLALIATELVSNALEHAFTEGRGGTIRVDLAVRGDERILTVADDGQGLPQGFSLESARSMGLRIVQSLAGQLDGRLAIKSDAGTTFRLTFPA